MVERLPLQIVWESAYVYLLGVAFDQRCMQSKHNMSALALDGVGYIHLKFG
jgi:hypothetical protein